MATPPSVHDSSVNVGSLLVTSAESSLNDAAAALMHAISAMGGIRPSAPAVSDASRTAAPQLPSRQLTETHLTGSLSISPGGSEPGLLPARVTALVPAVTPLLRSSAAPAETAAATTETAIIAPAPQALEEDLKIARISDALRLLKLTNGTCTSSNLTETFRAIELYESMITGASALGDNDAVKTYLISNPDKALEPKNEYGNNMLEQLETFLLAKLSVHRQLKELYTLQNAFSKETTPNVVKRFTELNIKSKAFFGRKVWEHFGSNPSAGVGFGDRKIAEDPLILIRENFLQQRINDLQDQIKLPFNFVITAPDPRDSNEVIATKYLIKQIDRFRNVLETSPYLEDKQMAFEALAPSLRGAISEVKWLCDGSPDGNLNYGTEAVLRDPHCALNTVNDDGKNLLEQLKDHFIVKYEALRAKRDIDALNIALTISVEQFRQVYRRLDSEGSPVADELAYRAYLQMGGASNAASHGNARYGQETILSQDNPRVFLERDKIKFSALKEEVDRRSSVDITKTLRTSMGIERLVERYPYAEAQKVHRVAMISAELQGVVSEGGLGSAVNGMAKGLGYKNVCMIMPKYGNEAVSKDARTTDADVVPELAITVPVLDDEGRSTGVERTHRVFRKFVNGTSPAAHDGVETFFIEDDEHFYIHAGEKIYHSDPSGGRAKRRFAHFQRLAAELALKFYNTPGADGSRKIDVVHVQDAQSALVPEYYAQRHFDKWKKGETPPTVYTFHNNLPGTQDRYDTHAHTAALGQIGLKREDLIAYERGLKAADVVTTVSDYFAEQAQTLTFGEGLQGVVKGVSNQGNLVSILNGNTLGMNPKTDKTLKEWIDIAPKEIVRDDAGAPIGILPATEVARCRASGTDPRTMASFVKWTDVHPSRIECDASGSPVRISENLNLTYGPEDTPEVIAAKKQLCKEQLAAYVERYGLGKLDPSKPILLYIGRLDPYQKGIDKLALIMEKAKELGAQMLVIGPKADRQANGDYADPTMKGCMEHLYRTRDTLNLDGGRNTGGFIVIEDEKIGNSYRWQQGHRRTAADGITQEAVPGFGSVLRAAADLGVFPSLTEPCGLVQGESWLFGCRVLASDVGGFHDTIISQRDKDYADKPGTVNGFKFERDVNWTSMAQKTHIERALTEAVRAIKAGHATPAALKAYHAQTKLIMSEARQSTWTRTPAKLRLAVAQLNHIFTKADESAKILIEELINNAADGILGTGVRPTEWTTIETRISSSPTWEDRLSLSAIKLSYIYTHGSDETIKDVLEPTIVETLKELPGAKPEYTKEWFSAIEKLNYAYTLAEKRSKQRARAHFDLRGLEISLISDRAHPLRGVAVSA